jgi:hypothetical protein
MKSIRGLLLACAAAFTLAGALSPATAAPIAYSTVNIPADTPQTLPIALIAAINSSGPAFASVVTCTGTTTSTCQGLKIVTSYSGLTTAAGVTSAAQTVTNASVAATSLVFCQSMGYGGTGNPVVVNVIPGAGSFTYLIENTHASAALNATVPVACMVYN